MAEFKDLIKDKYHIDEYGNLLRDEYGNILRPKVHIITPEDIESLCKEDGYYYDIRSGKKYDRHGMEYK